MTDIQDPENEAPEAAEVDVALRTFGFVIAIALTLIAFSFVYDFAREIF